MRLCVSEARNALSVRSASLDAIDDAVLGLPSDASPSDPYVKRALVAAATQRFNEDDPIIAALEKTVAALEDTGLKPIAARMKTGFER